MTTTSPTSSISIVYDGECPVCSAYVTMLRLRALGEVELINARDDHPLVKTLEASGVDLDEGMAVKVGEELYLGDQAVQRMALMTSRNSFFNRLNYWIFRSATRSRLLYPILRAGRNLLLSLLGRTSIAAGKTPDHSAK